MEHKLTGKTALVTAAANGIGRASAEALAARGATVITTDIAEDRLTELSATPGITGQRLDVMDTGAVLALVAAHGSFDLNAKAMYQVIRAALPGMLDRGAGSIINIASIVSSKKGAPRRFAYGASKAAIIGMTKAIAADSVKEGVRCNAICPGTVQSPSLNDRLAATGDFDAALTAFKARQPMGRLGQPEEIAEMVCYLASDMAGFTTGQALATDVGRSI